MSTDQPPADATRLSGWGAAGGTVSDVVSVGAERLAEVVKDTGPRGLVARGLGRSYGDPAQNSGGAVVLLEGGRDDIVIDDLAGTATVGAGVSIAELLDVIVPRGYFVPVTPGTRFVTIGGAVASDIHGKNHHAGGSSGGSFGTHVTALRMMLADTTIVDIGPDRDAELFWATVGGMGLTGVIVSVTFRLLPIDTSRMSVETRRIDDLDELMARMSETDTGFRYSVAWLDVMAGGRHLGRGVLTNGEHATPDQLDARAALAPLEYSGRQLGSVPPLIPSTGVINRFTVRAFNEMWFRKAPRERSGEIQSIATYFHPLDMAGEWNRVYGRDGVVQYQFVVPHGADDTLRTVIGRMSAAGVPSFLTVLKRFGPANPGMLSFPLGGWTLAVDIPGGRPGLASFLGGLDELVLAAGGRHYLAKDFHMGPAALRAGYPRLDEWLAVRERVDPAGVFASDMSRRLGLSPTTLAPTPTPAGDPIAQRAR